MVRVTVRVTLLYPLQWQHIFIPVLPKSKFSYAAAPMPFVVGVLARHLPRLQREAIDPEVIFVDLDAGRISADDAETIERAQLPRALRDELHARLVQLQRQAKARSALLDTNPNPNPNPNPNTKPNTNPNPNPNPNQGALRPARQRRPR